MKFSLIPSIVAALSGLATSSPVEAMSPAEGALLSKRASGTLKAWTSSGSGCSGNPGFSWPDPGQNQCITFVGGNGSPKIVQRLSWSGQACQVYGYSDSACTDQEATAFGPDICFLNVLFLSFKVVC
ncbi:hypothetical protein GQ53DRAFT_766887 [Thozetella sp. PMI_491]|nr:hypothetical protein GQ53DRAFT_766887 [Thozetella sp. PMI_491]